jgi:hypothetical protein
MKAYKGLAEIVNQRMKRPFQGILMLLAFMASAAPPIPATTVHSSTPIVDSWDSWWLYSAPGANWNAAGSHDVHLFIFAGGAYSDVIAVASPIVPPNRLAIDVDASLRGAQLAGKPVRRYGDSTASLVRTQVSRSKIGLLQSTTSIPFAQIIGALAAKGYRVDPILVTPPRASLSPRLTPAFRTTQDLPIHWSGAIRNASRASYSRSRDRLTGLSPRSQLRYLLADRRCRGAIHVCLLLQPGSIVFEFKVLLVPCIAWAALGAIYRSNRRSDAARRDVQDYDALAMKYTKNSDAAISMIRKMEAALAADPDPERTARAVRTFNTKGFMRGWDFVAKTVQQLPDRGPSLRIYISASGAVESRKRPKVFQRLLSRCSDPSRTSPRGDYCHPLTNITAVAVSYRRVHRAVRANDVTPRHIMTSAMNGYQMRHRRLWDRRRCGVGY